jgi:hypothetical protein
MKIGTDPEFFIIGPGGRPVPAHRFFPSKTEKLRAGNALLFRDGYALEINVPPREQPYVLLSDVEMALKAATALLPAGHKLVARPAVRINLRKDMADAPEDVRYFGCDPSWCAYTGAQKVPAITAMRHPWRYAGSHMHFSINEEEQKKKEWAWMKNREAHRWFIRLMDQFVGYMLTLRSFTALDALRRRYYGGAGEYRPQEYPDGSVGLEYRTPSGPLDAGMFRVGMELFQNMGTFTDRRAQTEMKWINESLRTFIDKGRG